MAGRGQRVDQRSAGRRSGVAGPSRRRALWLVAALGLAGAAGIVAAGVAALIPAGAAVGSTGEPLVAVGHSPSTPKGATAIGALPGATRLHALVELNVRNPAALAAFVTSVSNPASPNYGHYLAKGQFTTRFGPTQASVDSVVASLRADGLSVGPPGPERLTVPVTGTAAQLSTAFHTDLERYRLPDGQVGHQNTSAPAFPVSVAGLLTGVVGLDSFVRNTPMLTPSHLPTPAKPATGATGAAAATPAIRPLATGKTGSTACKTAKTNEWVGSDEAYTWTELAKAYDYTTAYSAAHLGSGETIGLFELEPYSTTDVTAFKNCYALPSGETYGSVTAVPVDGFSTTGAGSGEAILDIETLLGLAPEANVQVYEAPNTDSGTGIIKEWQHFAVQDTDKIISSSWGTCEPKFTSSLAETENTAFEQAAAQGQTIFVASGDDGSAACYPNTKTTKLAVSTPASQPYVTGVGGTDLTTTGNGSTKAPTETVWNEKSKKEGAGGGGVSEWWAKPAWQDVTATAEPTGTCKKQPGTSATTATCRQVPDVSASADPTHGDLIYCKGTGLGTCTTKTIYGYWGDIGGTSAASPTWAAMAALADQSCGYSLGFLNPRLYQMGNLSQEGFHDISSGTNNYEGTHTGDYDAKAGYDNASGWGSPNGQKFFSDVCPTSLTSVSASPSPTTAGSSAKYTVKFTTSSTGALTAGETVTVVGPAGMKLPSTTTDYSITSPAGVTVSSVKITKIHTSPTGDTNVAAIKLGTAIAASTAVTLTISAATNQTTAGSTSLDVWTTTDAKPISASYSITAGTPSASESTVVASTTSTTAGTKVSITVTEKDAYGNLVTGKTVALTKSSGTHATYTPTSKATTTGVAKFTVTDTTAEAVTFTAKNTTPAVTFTTTPKVTWKAGTVSASASTVVASTTSTTAGTVVSITVTEKDAYGNLVTGKTVALTKSAGTHATYTPTSKATTTGVAKFTVTDTTAEAVTFTAKNTTPAVTFTTTPKITWKAGTPSVTKTTVVASTTSTTAGTVVSVTVTEKDAYGNLVTGKTVALTKSAGTHATYTPTSKATTTGVAKFTVTDTTAEAVTFTAKNTTPAVTFTTTPVVTWKAGTVSASASTVVASATSTTAGTKISITVTEKDQYGNLVTGKTVALTKSAGTHATYTPTSKATTTGVAKFTVTDTTAEAVTFTAKNTTPAVTFTTTPTVTWKAGAPSTTKTTVVASATSTTAGTVVSVTVTEKDAYGNLVTGKTVALTKSAGTHATYTPTSKATTTGVAKFTVTDTVAEAVTFTAKNTTPAVAFSTTPTVTWKAGKASAAKTTLVPSKTTATAGTTVTVTVTVKDAYGNPVSANSVRLVQTGVASITPTTRTTNATGVATFNVKDGVAQKDTISAQDLTSDVTFTSITVTWKVGPLDPTNSFVTASASTTTAGKTVTVTVYERDAYTNSIVGDAVTLAGSTGSQAVITGTPGTTNTAGIVVFKVTDTTAQKVTFTARDTTAGKTLTATPSVTWKPGAPSATRSTVVASTGSTTAGTKVSITVTERDAYGNLVTGDTVALTKSAGAHATYTPASKATATGVATFTVTDTTAEAVTFTAKNTTPAVTFTTKPTVTWKAGAATAGTTTVVASAGSTTAGTTVSITITERDAYGNLVTGDTVTLTKSAGAHATYTPASKATATGVAKFTVADTVAEAVTFTAKNTTPAVTFTTKPIVTWKAGSPSASKTTVVASAGSTTAGTTVSITVTERDQYGNLVTGKTVALTKSAGTFATYSPASKATTTGVAKFTVTDTVAETVTFTAKNTTPAVTFTTKPSVTWKPGSPTTLISTVVASANSTTAGSTVSITVTEMDQFGNLVTGDTVALTRSAGSHATYTPAARATVTGVAKFTVTDTTAESVTFTARDTTHSVTFFTMPTVAWKPGPPSASMTTVVASAGSAAAGTSVSVTVTEKDAYGNLVTGKTVALTKSAGTHTTYTPASKATTTGVATFTVTDTVAEAVTFTAKSTTPAVTFTTTPVVTWKAGVPSASMTTVVASAGSAAAGTSVSVTVTEKDAYGNTVSGDSITLTGSTGSKATVTSSPTTTNATGVAKFTVNDTTAQKVTFTAKDTTASVTLDNQALGHLEARSLLGHHDHGGGLGGLGARQGHRSWSPSPRRTPTAT